jgi:hypothetical protein
MASCEKCEGPATVLCVDQVGAPSDPVAGWLMCDSCRATSEEDGEWCDVVELAVIDALPHSEYLGESATLVRIDQARSRVRYRAPNVTEDDVKEMVRLYESGMGIRKVAAELGLSQATVYRQMNAHGYAFRRPGRQAKAAA